MAEPNEYRPGRTFTSRTFPVIPPIYQTTTFELDDQAYADIQGTGGLHETWYSRFGNPTVDAAAAEVARLHAARQSLMTASGMAAIATTLVTLVRSGDTLVASKQVYGDTGDLLARDLPALGVDVVRVDAFDVDGWRSAIAEHRPAVVYGETLSNPQLRVLDIPAIAGAAHAVGATVVVDNTFATPYCARPLQLGADVVVESATKFLAGHSDVVAGARDHRRRRPARGDPAAAHHVRRLPGPARRVPGLARPTHVPGPDGRGVPYRRGTRRRHGQARRRRARRLPGTPRPPGRGRRYGFPGDAARLRCHADPGASRAATSGR